MHTGVGGQVAGVGGDTNHHTPWQAIMRYERVDHCSSAETVQGPRVEAASEHHKAWEPAEGSPGFVEMNLVATVVRAQRAFISTP